MVLLTANLNLGGAWSFVVLAVLVGSVVVGVDVSETRALRKLFCNFESEKKDVKYHSNVRDGK